MTKNTMEDALAVLHAHEKAEMEVDYDATIATLVDNPHYELPTLGYKLDGMEAVGEFYRRTLPYFAAKEITADVRVHALDESGTILCREAYPIVVINGERIQCNYSAVILLEGGKILGERLYVDPYFGSLFEESLGDDFDQIPGVSRLPWVAHVAAHA